MNAPATLFASAYRQLRPAERAYVDGYVSGVERDADRRGERISNALHRVIPDDVIEASRGMLDRPLVRAAIAERINDLAAASELTPQRVVKEIMGVAFASLGDYMQIGEDGQPYFDLSTCTPEQLAAISSVEIEERQTRAGTDRKFKFKLHPKLDAIDKLARYMGLFDTDNAHWRSSQARPVTEAPALAADVSAVDAGDAYARFLGEKL